MRLSRALPGFLGLLACVASARGAGSPPDASAEPPRLSSITDRFDHLSVGDAVTVSDATLEAGRLTCRLKSGRAAPVRAGDEVVGVFFEGQAAMEYVSTEPVEAPVVVFDAKKSSSLAVEKTARGVVLRDSPKRVLWLARRLPLPPLGGAPAPPLAASFARQREKFGRMHAPPLSHDFALHELDAPESPLAWVEMDGGREDLLYALDGSDDASEGLAILLDSESRETELRKFLWLTTLSLQPIGRDRRDPPTPRFRLTDVDLELAATAGNDAKLNVTETISPVGRPARALRFDLDRTIYAPVGRNLATRTAKATRVRDERGRELAFDHRMDELVVELAEPAPPDRPLKLTFEIEGDFLVRPNGDNYWELGIWPWFPQPELSGQEYTFHARVRVPKPFVPFAPGVTVRRDEDGGDNVLETRVDRPIQFAVILAGRYLVEDDEREGVRVRVATYGFDNPRGRRQILQVAGEVISYYRALLGDFPFPELDILEINDYGYGQSPPGTMFITKEVFDPLVGDMSRNTTQEIVKTFAHEIAHQYWGIVVRVPDAEEQWIAESFAEYCAAMFLKDKRSEAAFDSTRKRWKPGADFATDVAPIPLANRVWIAGDALRRAEIRSGLLYDKGPLLLDAIHKRLGDAAFREFLLRAQGELRWKFGTTPQIVRLLDGAGAGDWKDFFDKNYWGTGMPKEKE
ncbi:MAG TPA: M1 family aminopeptidase [Thermoanaerobaculia bacterium]|nr:M1 family aminopeptidase [Thermoanaerobaculia bacterium]